MLEVDVHRDVHRDVELSSQIRVHEEPACRVVGARAHQFLAGIRERYEIAPGDPSGRVFPEEVEPRRAARAPAAALIAPRDQRSSRSGGEHDRQGCKLLCAVGGKLLAAAGPGGITGGDGIPGEGSEMRGRSLGSEAESGACGRRRTGGSDKGGEYDERAQDGKARCAHAYLRDRRSDAVEENRALKRPARYALILVEGA